MANTTKTHKDFYGDIIALVKEVAPEREDIIEFAEGRIEALVRKSTQTSKKRKEEVEGRKVLCGIIMDILEGGEVKSIPELMEADEVLSTLTNQKISSILKTLVDDGKVEKTKIKGSKVMHYYRPDSYTPPVEDDND